MGPVVFAFLFTIAVLALGAGAREPALRVRHHLRTRTATSTRRHLLRRPARPRLPGANRRRGFVLVATLAALLVLAATVAFAFKGHQHNRVVARHRPGRAARATAVEAAAVSRAPATSEDLVIRVQHPRRGLGDIAELGPWSMRDPTLRRAIHTLGPPSSQSALRATFAGISARSCVVTWARTGLRAVFTSTLMLPGACNLDAVITAATVTGRVSWRTWAGLRVGDPADAIATRHPHAKLHGSVWWLATS